MSFSYEQKKEIIEHVYKSSCCRRSLLCGILFAKGSCEGKSVKVTLEKVEYADFPPPHPREIPQLVKR